MPSTAATVYTAPRLAPLADHLLDHLAAAPLADPLQREVVIVAQNRGLRPWLEFRLAERFGCAGSYAFPSPSGFVSGVARRLLRAPASDAPWGLDGLTWRVYAWLGAHGGEIAALRRFLDGSDGRRMALARRTARVFDGYQVNRPELLAAWAAGGQPVDGSAAPHAEWQAELWQALVRTAPAPPPCDTLLRLIAALRDDDPPVTNVPEQLGLERVTVFGADIFPPLYLAALHGLARHVDVRFYVPLAPNDDGGLRGALGARGRTYRTLTGALSGGTHRTVDVEAAPAPHRATLLRAVQNAVMQRTSPPLPRSPEDASIQVHACHGPLREVEVLRDQLVHAMAEVDGLTWDEVLVIAPDLDTYAPLLEAVFQGEGLIEGDAAPVRIPLHVADGPWSRGYRTRQAFLALVALGAGRVTGTDVLDLLAYPVVRRAAGLGSRDLPAVRRWLEGLGVRWAFDGPDKERYGVPADDEATWHEAVRRLLLGHATGPVDERVWGLQPYAVDDEDAERLGRFAAWFRRLHAWSAAARRAQPVAAWAAHFTEGLATFLAASDDDEHEAVAGVRGAINDLFHALPQAGGGEHIAFEAVQHVLGEAVEAVEADEAFLLGGVTVTDAVSLRHAPFRVVAWLGLNAGAYPRTETETAVDLSATVQAASLDGPVPSCTTVAREGAVGSWAAVQRVWLQGDTQRRVFDAQLFLDALLATEERFLCFYSAQSPTDHRERYPSGVLEELLEACDAAGAAAGWGLQREGVLRRHRLQPFSPAYYRTDSPLFSYAHHHCPTSSASGAGPWIARALPSPTEELDLTLEELAEAWVNPSADFCRRRLGLWLGQTVGVLQDRPPIALSGLQAYHVKHRLLEMGVAGVPADEQLARLRAEAVLPPGALGDAWFWRLYREVAPLCSSIGAVAMGPPVHGELSGTGWHVSARLDHVSDQAVVRFRPGTLKPKDRIRAWVTHVVVNALADAGAALPRETWVWGEGVRGRFEPLPDAQRVLADLVDGVRTIRTAPPPLFERASHALFTARSNPLARAQQAFTTTTYARGDDSDPYVQLCHRDRTPMADSEACTAWAARLWAPLLEKYEEETV